MLLEAVAIQDVQNRVFLFIQYLYLDETRPETRKRPKKWADLCEAKAGVEPSRISSIDLGFAAGVKSQRFSWPVYSSQTLVESLKLSMYCIRCELEISQKPSDYFERKRSSESQIKRILQVRKLHGKLNSSRFLFSKQRLLVPKSKRNLRSTRRLRLLTLRTGELAMYLWILHVITSHATLRGAPEVVNPAMFSNGYSEYKIVLFFEFHH